MKPADPTIADHYDAYRIQVLDDNYFRYAKQSIGQQYSVKKMPKDFRLPITLKSGEAGVLTFSY